MSASAIDFEQATLSRLRDDFEAKGYRFIIQPTPEDLPHFVKLRPPDAIAIGRDDVDKVIIEVKRVENRDAKAPMAEVDRDLAAKEGWRYLLVYAGQDPSEIVELSRPLKSQVDNAIDEVHSLEQSGYLRAAMLEGWSLLEALARRIYPHDIRVSLRPLSPIAVVERLAMDGQISGPEAKRLRAMGAIRNSVAHGDLNVSVSPDDLRFLLERVESINARVTA